MPRAWVGLLAGIAFVCGCYRSHTVEGGRDAEVPDAEAIDARVGDAGPSCASSTTRVTVAVERVGRVGCDGPELSGSLTSLEAETSIDGLRIRVDTCPDADEDCRCEITVGGIGSDLVPSLGVVSGPFRAVVQSASIVLVATVSGGEAGEYRDSLVLFAEDGYLDHPFTLVDGVTLISGETCRVLHGTSSVGPCEQIEYSALVRVSAEASGWPSWTMGGEARVREGETVSIPGTFANARLVRANELVCMPEGTPAPPAPEAAWVMFWSWPPAP